MLLNQAFPCLVMVTWGYLEMNLLGHFKQYPHNELLQILENTQSMSLCISGKPIKMCDLGMFLTFALYP